MRRSSGTLRHSLLTPFSAQDFDIAGEYNAEMVPDAECVKIVTEVLDSLNLGNYVVKVGGKRVAVFVVLNFLHRSTAASCWTAFLRSPASIPVASAPFALRLTS